MREMPVRPDLLYVEAAGDIVKSWRDWQRGIATPEETAITFSSQVFALAREQGWSLLALSFSDRHDRVADGDQVAMTRARPWQGRGLFYYLAELCNGLWLVWLVLRLRPRRVVVSSGVCLWISLLPLRLLPVKVILSMHNTPWPAGFQPTGRSRRWLLALDGFFFRHGADAALCVSPEVARQMLALAGPDGVHIQSHLPQYRPGHLRPVARRAGERPFRIIFAGRIEIDKGVLDIVRMAEVLRAQGVSDCVFEVCGDGSALDALRAAIAAAGLEGQVVLHGRLARTELVVVYERAHLAIVPTRSSFAEGFAMVAAEAVMTGLPVLTSPVVPAAEVLGDAVCLATTDDVASYVEQIVLLMREPARHAACVAACAAVAGLFTQPERGFGAALAQACAKA